MTKRIFVTGSSDGLSPATLGVELLVDGGRSDKARGRRDAHRSHDVRERRGTGLGASR
jgi:hypothetical protein